MLSRLLLRHSLPFQSTLKGQQVICTKVENSRHCKSLLYFIVHSYLSLVRVTFILGTKLMPKTRKNTIRQISMWPWHIHIYYAHSILLYRCVSQNGWRTIQLRIFQLGLFNPSVKTQVHFTQAF